MRVLWDRGESTVVEVQERLLPERRLAATTVATILSRLEKRGVISHRVEGRQYIYRPEVSEPEVRRSMVSRITDVLFDGSPAALISHLLSSRQIARGDLARVREMIDEEEGKSREKGKRGTRGGAGTGRDA
jgi:predicted transcriptional regulator